MFASDLMILDVVCSDCEEKEAPFCNLYVAYGTTTSSNHNPSKFLTVVNSWKHIYQRIDEHESSQKHKACVEAHIQFSSNKTVVDLITVSQTSLHKKQIMQRRQILDRVVSIVKSIGKRGTSYRGTGSSKAVSTLCDEKVDHGTFLETVLLAKYDNILKCLLENVIKRCLQNKPDKHKHNRANRNTFISKTRVNSIIAITSNLMKKEISNSVREAGIYSVQIDSTQDTTSTDKCSVILRFVRENVEERLLAIVDSHSATGVDLSNLLKEVLQKQNIDVSKCIPDSTDGATNMSGQYNGSFLEKESPGLIHTWCYAYVLNLVLCDVTMTNHALYLYLD